jgi:hypothetical protein
MDAGNLLDKVSDNLRLLASAWTRRRLAARPK